MWQTVRLRLAFNNNEKTNYLILFFLSPVGLQFTIIDIYLKNI
jgi:hypothetical protein